MEKLLLLNPPAKNLYLRDYFCSSLSKAGYCWQPIDFLVISGLLKNNYEVFVLDCIAEKLSFSNSLNIINKISPDILIFLSSTLSYKEDFDFVKKIPAKKIFGIGEIFLGNTKEILKENSFINGTILDFTNSRLKDFIEKPENFGNVLYFEETKFFLYPIPLYEKFPLKKYNYPLHLFNPYASVLTTYGCPFKCHFCNSGSLGFKLRDVENVLEEIFYVRKKLNIKQIFIKDMTFLSNREHSLEILRQIIKNKLDIVFNCYTRVELLDEEIIYYLKKSGCHLIQLGIEHIDKEFLKKFGKNIDLEKTKKIVGLLKKYKIKFGMHFIFGLPGDTKDSIKKILDFVKEIQPDYVSFNIFYPRVASVLENCVPEENSELKKYVNFAYLKYYFSFRYIFRRIMTLKTLYELRNLLYSAFSLLKNII
jgi:radical SAM superfamily enzyme YgiQ (UPF0313 family)